MKKNIAFTRVVGPMHQPPPVRCNGKSALPILLLLGKSDINELLSHM